MHTTPCYFTTLLGTALRIAHRRKVFRESSGKKPPVAAASATAASAAPTAAALCQIQIGHRLMGASLPSPLGRSLCSLALSCTAAEI
jgi:hypothetical protein